MSKSFYEKHEGKIESILNRLEMFSLLALSVALLVVSVFYFAWNARILSFILFIAGICLTYISGTLAEIESERFKQESAKS